MRTKIARLESPGVAALRRLLAGPLEVRIDGAEAYWLGDVHGEPMGPESDRTLDPCAQALRLVQAGVDPDTLVLWARLADGESCRVSGGICLVDRAEAAAGVPARTRDAGTVVGVSGGRVSQYRKPHG